MSFTLEKRTLLGSKNAHVWERLKLGTLLLVAFSFILRLCFLRANELIVEEAYYWHYANHLAFGYLDHPPMVALLIRAGTFLLGDSEMGIRIASLSCWLLTAFFNYRLTNEIKQGSAVYTLLFLSILPSFFIFSIVMTPDSPLIACWSATLFYLYRAMVKQNADSWYYAGIWFGLGLFSKYTIGLLGAATFIYLVLMPRARHWLLKKEPYVALCISVIIFSPVIYWNATHQWASFAFQSSRRFSAAFEFSFHHYLGLVFIFFLPPGLLGLKRLMSGKTNNFLSVESIRFLQVFTFFPLLFFGFFSLTHGIKFNWIGPIVLSATPLFAIVCHQKAHYRRHWFLCAVIMLVVYLLVAICVSTGKPTSAYHALFKKLISWQELTLNANQIASQVEKKYKVTPTLVPLDLYNLNSELGFYQQRLLDKKMIDKPYPVVGRHLFGGDSLMFQYWSTPANLKGALLILLSKEKDPFFYKENSETVTDLSPLQVFYAKSQGSREPVTPVYYKVASLKAPAKQ